MKKSSKYAIKKKVDYFELLNKSTTRAKFKFNENVSEEGIVTVKVINNNSIAETQIVKTRKAELNAIKAEIYQLITTGLSKIDVVDDIFTRKRRTELMYSKKLIEDEVKAKPLSSFIFKTLIS